MTFMVGDNSTFWVDAEKRDSLNEAIMVWQAMTGQAVGSVNLLATGENFYDVPRQFVSVQRVTIDGTPLSPTSLAELDYGSPGWEGVAGTPTAWAPVGLGLIVVSPAPTSGTLILEGILDGPRLMADSDMIKFNDDVVLPLEHYAHHYLTFKEGGQEFQGTEDEMKAIIEAAGIKNQELRALALYRRWLGKTNDERARLGESRVGVRN